MTILGLFLLCFQAPSNTAPATVSVHIHCDGDPSLELQHSQDESEQVFNITVPTKVHIPSRQYMNNEGINGHAHLLYHRKKEYKRWRDIQKEAQRQMENASLLLAMSTWVHACNGMWWRRVCVLVIDLHVLYHIHRKVNSISMIQLLTGLLQTMKMISITNLLKTITRRSFVNTSGLFLPPIDKLCL